MRSALMLTGVMPKHICAGSKVCEVCLVALWCAGNKGMLTRPIVYISHFRRALCTYHRTQAVENTVHFNSWRDLEKRQPALSLCPLAHQAPSWHSSRLAQAYPFTKSSTLTTCACFGSTFSHSSRCTSSSLSQHASCSTTIL